jgi:flavin-dependent dehydrogenase
MKKFDVAILGAGPAGSVAAHVLLKLGRSVLILDQPKRMAEGRKVGESLPSAARPLLRHLGLLKLVEKGPHLSSFGNHSAWGSPRIETNDFIRDPNGLGWHLDRARFDSDLRTNALARGARLEYGKVRDFAAVPARFLIDASGRAASLAHAMGARRLRDDQLMAVFMWVQPQAGDRDTRTLLESTRDGWWYTARLMDHSRIVVFHTDRNKVAGLLRSPLMWNIELRRTLHIRETIEGAKTLSELYCTEASGARLDHFHGANWTAAGDAALSFDPLSSQGLFNAIYTGMKAGEAAHAALSGRREVLRDYADRLEQIRRVYVARRQMYYAAETRWTDSSFWKQRIYAG